MTLGLRRRRPITGDRKPWGGRPNEVEGEGAWGIGAEIEADRADWGGRAPGDRCVD